MFKREMAVIKNFSIVDQFIDNIINTVKNLQAQRKEKITKNIFLLFHTSCIYTFTQNNRRDTIILVKKNCNNDSSNGMESAVSRSLYRPNNINVADRMSSNFEKKVRKKIILSTGLPSKLRFVEKVLSLLREIAFSR